MKLTLLILLVLIPSITTLQCYVCNSLENANCEKTATLEESFKKTCPPTVEPYCRRIDQTIDGKKSVVRACGSKTGTKSCYKTAGLNHANVCSCNADLCNNAPSFNRQQIMTIVSSMIALAITMIVLR